MRQFVVVLFTFSILTAACGGPETVDENPLGALRVPQDYATIQEAVDATVEGDLVLIDAGVYHESISVETDNLVIRGVDRNTVILDGEHDEDAANGIIVFSNGVAIENLTVQNYFSNGLIEHSYASGGGDSGYYIGQCQPCNVVITDSISEYNALGYSGTNAGGDLYVVNNVFSHNRAGIVPNTLDSEELAPQKGATFAGNHIFDSGNPATSSKTTPALVWPSPGCPMRTSGRPSAIL